MYFTGGAATPWIAGLSNAAVIGGGVGLVEAARTGDIGKGLMAGLGAYGGANLVGSLSTTGANVLSGEATSLAANEAAKAAGADAVALGTEQGLSPEAIDAMKRQAIDDAGSATARVTPNTTAFENLKAGTASAANNPMQFLKANATPLAMATGPAILAGMSAKNNMPQTVTQPGRVTPYTYDPYSGTSIAANSYEVPVKKAAGGGLMNLAYNNSSGGMFDFTKDGSNEPVVRSMADGGVAHFAMGDVVQGELEQAYAGNDVDRINSIISQNQITAEDVGNTWKGFDTSGLAGMGVNLYTPPSGGGGGGGGGLEAFGPAVVNLANADGGGGAPQYTSYAPQQMQDYIRDNQIMTGDPAQLAAAVKATNADPAAVDAYLAGIRPTATALSTRPAGYEPYTNYTNDQYGAFFADPKNAGVLQTPGGLAAAEKQFNADPNATMKYLQTIGTAPLKLSAADLYQLSNNQGTEGVDKAIGAWIADPAHKNATGKEISDALKAAGMDQNDVEKYFNTKNSAYGTNLATGKAFTGAGDIYQIGQGKGFADVTTGIQAWIQEHPKATLTEAQAAMSKAGINELDVIRATGMNSADFIKKAAASLTTVTGGTGNDTLRGGTGNDVISRATNVTAPTGIATADKTALPAGVSGAGITTVNPNGTITTRPDLSLGMKEVRDDYVRGGGNLGYTSYVPKSIEDFNAKYNTLTGGSKQSFDYLTGKADYNPVPYTKTGEIMKPYAESVLGVPTASSKKMYLFDPTTKQYKLNPDYAIPTYDTSGKKTYNVTNRDVADYMAKKPSGSDFYNWAKTNNLTVEQIAAATGLSIADIQKMLTAGQATDAAKAPAIDTQQPSAGDGGGGGEANGGLMAMAGGGMAGQFDLGGYSDGGRLLRGPGDGVSDSIPATIAGKRPARLADGEFVVPARIVSELGNGSTEAGARKLYAMMDRVQAARKGSIGKGKVANNSRADKHLPA
jgi:hypothetical protein